jgi:2-polyprenyl-6-methoxyphenol hydroxylase-like FAD-dependent oxidoreductase
VQDVTIIGAGPAGSAAAIMLARRGWPVTLIEQHRFPRDKVCGECLSALGIDVLERLGFMPELREKGGISLVQAILHDSEGASHTIPLPRPMLGISRHVLDDLLLESARIAGVSIRQPARCERIDATSAGVSVHVRDLATNVLETIQSSFAILADGKAALPGPSPGNTGDMGIKTHFTGIDGPRDAIDLFGCRGCYGGLAAIERGRWNAAFSVPVERVRAHRGDIDELFDELVRENLSLARRVARAQRVLPWLASALPRFSVRKHWLARVIPIGNAVAALEPIGGEGMGLALRSAELAVDAIDRSSDNWDLSAERRLRLAFDNLWRVRRVACRAAALVASSTDVGNVALEWMRSNERLVAVAMRSMEKSSVVA